MSFSVGGIVEINKTIFGANGVRTRKQLLTKYKDGTLPNCIITEVVEIIAVTMDGKDCISEFSFLLLNLFNSDVGSVPMSKNENEGIEVAKKLIQIEEKFKKFNQNISFKGNCFVNFFFNIFFSTVAICDKDTYKSFVKYLEQHGKSCTVVLDYLHIMKSK